MASVPVIPFVPGGAGRRSGFERTRALLAQALLWPVHVARARRQLARIAAMSDRELRDIGLMRHDVRNATALRLDEDPTRYLAFGRHGPASGAARARRAGAIHRDGAGLRVRPGATGSGGVPASIWVSRASSRQVNSST